VADEYRRPWYQRWAGALGEPRRRWRAMDDERHAQVNWVLKAILVGVLVWISWPLALLVLALFAANYVDRYVPEKHAWARRWLIPTLDCDAVQQRLAYSAAMGGLIADTPSGCRKASRKLSRHAWTSCVSRCDIIAAWRARRSSIGIASA